jgi:hypothetical protein
MIAARRSRCRLRDSLQQLLTLQIFPVLLCDICIEPADRLGDIDNFPVVRLGRYGFGLDCVQRNGLSAHAERFRRAVRRNRAYSRSKRLIPPPNGVHEVATQPSARDLTNLLDTRRREFLKQRSS